MIETNSIPVSVSSVEALQPSDEHIRTGLALLGQLEASLRDSRKALLVRDLAGIEAGTRQQNILSREIEAFPWQAIAPFGSRLEEEMRQTGSRALAAGRLQAALLARAQRQLRVLANMLAGPSANYGPRLAAEEAFTSSRILGREPGCKPGWKRDWNRDRKPAGKRAGEF